jgi:hypothetical protein
MAVLVALVVVCGAVLAYRLVDACADWQHAYERFLYREMMKNSPIIYTPEMIEEIIGERPFGCDRPPRSLDSSGRVVSEESSLVRASADPALLDYERPSHPRVQLTEVRVPAGLQLGGV